MRRQLPGLIALLAASLVLGVGVGQVFFGLFHQTVPPAVLTAFNRTTAHGAFLLYGAGTGVVIFVWSLLAISGARLLSKSRRTGSADA